MFNFLDETKRIVDIITHGAKSAPTLLEIIQMEIQEFKSSKAHKTMLDGMDYYIGKQKILNKKRFGIEEGGQSATLHYLPNSKTVDNQYKKMVDQKSNYICGKPVAYTTQNEQYSAKLKSIFDESFNRNMKQSAKNSIIYGLAWLYIYINDLGRLAFRVLPTPEVLPFWSDDEHRRLDMACRMYKVQTYYGTTKKEVEHVELYTTDGIKYYIYEGGRLIEDVEKETQSYMTYIDNEDNSVQYNWSRIPLIPFKFNYEELPLLGRIKSLQDAINQILSNFEDNMLQDPYNTIYVLVNYDGQNLGEFRANLAKYGAVKIRTVSGVDGDVRTIEAKVDSTNYQAILSVLKKALIENAMGYDAKDDRVGSNANQMNIQSMYNDIDLDANGMELEFQSSLKQLMEFVDDYLYNTYGEDYHDEGVKFIFNRDMMMNETEIMNTLLSAGVRISQRTLLSQVPYITDEQEEIDRVKAEEAEPLNNENVNMFGLGGTNAE